MKTSILYISLMIAALLGVPAFSQSTTITASQIQSNLSGTLLVSGYFELTPVNALMQPTGFTSGSGGQVLPNAFFWPIVNGAISGVVVPDTADTVPSNVGYAVTVTDAAKRPLYNFGQAIHPTGSTWSFDAWSPTSTVIASPATAVMSGNLAPTGACTAPSLFYTPTALYTCVGSVWTVLSSGVGSGGMTALTGDISASGTGSVAATVKGLNGINLAGLSTGLLKNTTGTGAPSIAAPGTDYALPLGYTPANIASNLSDLGSIATARTNLGLGSASTQAASAFDPAGAASTAQAAAQGSSLQQSSNLSDLTNVATARTNLGLGSAATQPTTAFDASGAAATAQANSLQKSGNLSDVASAATARTNLGLGSAATQASGAFDAAGAASTAQAAAQASGLQKSSNLSDVASAATALSNLGGVLKTTTINGHALSANVVLSASDLSTGTLPSGVLPLATSSAVGAVKPDGTSCTVTSGVLSCSGSGGIVAQNIVHGQNTGVAAFTVYTPTAQGVYEMCAGFVVTTAGSTGATLQAGIRFTSSGTAAGPGIGSTAPATSVGATNGSGNVSTCQTVLPDAGTNLQVAFIVGGAPATNPTYTYWYVVANGSGSGSGGSASPGGPTGAVQYNNGGVLAGLNGTGLLMLNGSSAPSIAAPGTDYLSPNGSGAALTGLNASNLSSGTVPAARIPVPTASTLGGIESIAATSHEWLNSISTAGAPAESQPAFSDLSGSATAAQLPTFGTSVAGIVPASGGGTSTFLRADGTWATPPSGGGASITGAQYTVPVLNPANTLSGVSDISDNVSTQAILMDGGTSDLGVVTFGNLTNTNGTVVLVDTNNSSGSPYSGFVVSDNYGILFAVTSSLANGRTMTAEVPFASYDAYALYGTGLGLVGGQVIEDGMTTGFSSTELVSTTQLNNGDSNTMYSAHCFVTASASTSGSLTLSLTYADAVGAKTYAYPAITLSPTVATIVPVVSIGNVSKATHIAMSGTLTGTATYNLVCRALIE